MIMAGTNRPADWPTAQVKRGAAYLDDTYPGWRNRARVAGFIMSSASRCILTVATKGIGKGDFGRTREFNEYGREWCRDHGFLGFHDSGENDYSALKVEWQRILGMEPDDGE